MFAVGQSIVKGDCTANCTSNAPCLIVYSFGVNVTLITVKNDMCNIYTSYFHEAHDCGAQQVTADQKKPSAIAVRGLKRR